MVKERISLKSARPVLEYTNFMIFWTFSSILHNRYKEEYCLWKYFWEFTEYFMRIFGINFWLIYIKIQRICKRKFCLQKMGNSSKCKTLVVRNANPLVLVALLALFWNAWTTICRVLVRSYWTNDAWSMHLIYCSTLHSDEGRYTSFV